MAFGIIIFFIVIGLILLSSIKQVNQYDRGVKFRFGKFIGIMQPGWRLVIPVMESWQRVDLRVKTVDVTTQESVSKDNISIKVNAVLYYKVSDASKAILEVQHFGFAVSQLAQTTMRNIVGEFELDEILQQREEISKKIQQIVDKDTDQWGVTVTKIELKDIELPENMKRAIAAQAEAERDRRARITLALGEQQAATKLAQAAKIIGKEPSALQLRLFQTLAEVATEKNSTIIFPVPMELIEYVKKLTKDKK